jgi:hypothetical protein
VALIAERKSIICNSIWANVGYQLKNFLPVFEQAFLTKMVSSAAQFKEFQEN